jgi:hypothetical protein
MGRIFTINADEILPEIWGGLKMMFTGTCKFKSPQLPIAELQTTQSQITKSQNSLPI